MFIEYKHFQKKRTMRLLFILFLFPLIALGQEISLKGIITDSKNIGVQNASITISDPISLKNIQSIKTDSLGRFIIKGKFPNSILLEINHINFQTYQETINSDVFSKEIEIVLNPKTEVIQEITIEGRRPKIIRKVDRLVFDVQNSQLSALNSWDILSRTPLINIQGSKISVRGNQQIVVLINEKPTTMSGEELKQFLETTSGKDIQSIEVITNPPAKYEASGNAVINIKMKKNELIGYKGSVYEKYEQSNYGKQLFGLTNNFKTEKWNLKANYYFGRGVYARYGRDVINYPKDKTTWVSNIDRIDSSLFQHSYSFASEFIPDSTLNFTLALDGFSSPKSNGIYEVPTIIYNQTGSTNSNYHTRNDHDKSSKNLNLTFILNKKLNSNHSIDWSNYYSNNQSNHNQKINTLLNLAGQSPSDIRFISNNKNATSLFSSQIDIQSKLKDLSFEYGGKFSYVKNNNHLNFSDNETGTIQPNPNKSSNFDYEEKNLAAYISAEYAIKSWQFKAGLRAENTVLKGEVKPVSDINDTSYLTLFPTLYTLYKINDKQELSLSYGKRIARPSYTWLNPAKSYFNMFSYFQGDPRLRATISHNINLTYTNNNWIFDGFYSKSKWPNMEISFQNNDSNEIIYQYTNIKDGQAAGLSILKSFKISSNWNVDFDLTGFYNENKFLGLDNKLYKNDVFSYNGRVNSTYTLDKNMDWTLNLGYNYFSPSIQGPFKISSFSRTDLTSNVKLFQKKLDLSIGILDIFKATATTIKTKYADQDNYFYDYTDSRKFYISLRYNFGKQSIKGTKVIQKTDEQNRL